MLHAPPTPLLEHRVGHDDVSRGTVPKGRSRIGLEGQGALDVHGPPAVQEALDEVRGVFQHYVMIPGMKAAIAHYLDDPEWSRVRPPLDEMGPDERSRLLEALRAAGFEMRGLAAA